MRAARPRIPKLRLLVFFFIELEGLSPDPEDVLPGENSKSLKDDRGDGGVVGAVRGSVGETGMAGRGRSSVLGPGPGLEDSML
jgi:hypothetical protein